MKGADRQLSYVNEGFGELSKEKPMKGNVAQIKLPTAAGLFAG